MIDLVYLWCDDADVRWRAKREEAVRRFGSPGADAAASCRFRGGDVLRYSLRSAAVNVPWIRTVFLVIDDDQAVPDFPEVRDSKVRVVRHSEIVPPEFLPTFNSATIEHFLAEIPGLGDRFLLANDDTLFWRPSGPEFFFAADGLPFFRFGALRSRVADPQYREYVTTLENAERLVRDAFGLKGDFRRAFGRLPHHNVDAYLTADYREAQRRFREEIAASITSPFRAPQDVQRVLCADWALAVGRGHFRRATFNTKADAGWWRRLLPSWADSLQIVPGRWRKGPELIDRFKPRLVCFNDGPSTEAGDLAWLRAYLDGRFQEAKL